MPGGCGGGGSGVGGDGGLGGAEGGASMLHSWQHRSGVYSLDSKLVSGVVPPASTSPPGLISVPESVA